MTTSTAVEQWRKDRAGASRDEFSIRHEYAFLVWSPSFRVARRGARPSMPQLAFQTQIHGPDTGLLPIPQVLPEEELILPLRKAPSSPFPDRVSLGRAPNCDIVIRDSSVSKLHGHFREISRQSAVFTDARSSNGTNVDGVRLEPGVPTGMGEFSQITIGRVRLRLLSPGELYDWLAQLR